MKIKVKEYDPSWAKQFDLLKLELEDLLSQTNTYIEHIGSTSVPGLASKPVIDILVGINHKSQLDETISQLLKNDDYSYLEAYNEFAPDRRLFVRIKPDTPKDLFKSNYRTLEETPHELINKYRWSHVHIWEHECDNWYRHIAFRNYLRTHPKVCSEYQNLKLRLSKRDWKDGMEYNKYKNDFIKVEEQKALDWYHKNA